MSPNDDSRCDDGGWLVPSRIPLTDHAWRTGEPITGCSHLTCVRCGRRVVAFADALLAKRPDDREWLAVYDEGGFGPYLGPPIRGHDFRTYLCGCRARAAGSSDTADTLAIDDDLPWLCGGHPAG